MRICLRIALLAGILFTALPAIGGEESEEDAFYARAQRLEKDRHYEKAIDAYELVIREWGLDGRLAVECHLRISGCLVKLERVKDAIHVLEVAKDRYEASEAATETIDRDLKRLWRSMTNGDRRGDLERRLEELERRLKEEGLEGEELEEAYRRQKRRLENAEAARARAAEALTRAEAARQKLDAKLERMVQLWSESDVPPGEILDRVARLRMQHERAEAGRREVEALAQKFREEGLSEEEIHRKVQEMERRLNEEMEEGWRGRREEEMGAARREFIHLAERLGIPVHEAERFLEEHARRRAPGHSDRPFHTEGRAPSRNPDRVAEKVEAMEGFLFKLEDTLGRVMERLERLEQRLGGLEEK